MIRHESIFSTRWLTLIDEARRRRKISTDEAAAYRGQFKQTGELALVESHKHFRMFMWLAGRKRRLRRRGECTEAARRKAAAKKNFERKFNIVRPQNRRATFF